MMTYKMNSKHITPYNTDASRLIGKTNKIIFPKTQEEVKKIVKLENSLVPRGGGTNLVGGCIPNDSIVIDLSKMNKVSKLDLKQRTIRVEAGTTIKELNEKLSAIHLEFPIIPYNLSATIGGMIATNASGDYTLKYGTMKEWIEEIEFVNGRGELIKTTKSDISDVCGMEGITGVITAATLKLIPKTKHSFSIFQSDNLDEILSITRRIKLEKEVIMLQLIPPLTSKILELPEKYNLIIEFNSERGKIKGQEYNQIIKIKNKIFHKLFSEHYYNVEDPKFFFDKIKEFMLFLEINKIPYFSYLGSGIVHPFFKDNEEHKRRAIIDFIKKSRAKPSKFGIGLKRKELIDSFERKVIERVKLRYDPFIKINKGKLIDTDFNEKRLEDLEESRKRITVEPKIKPSEGEEKSAKSILNEFNKFSNEPNKSLNEFNKPLKEPEIKMHQLIKQAEEIENQESETEQILTSDPLSEKRKIIEEFTRNLISKKEDSSENSNEELSKQQHSEEEKQEIKPPSRQTSDKDRDLINRIMTNKFKKPDEK